MAHGERLPSSPVLNELTPETALLLKARNERIARYCASMEGRSARDVLQDVFRDVETVEGDVTFPPVHAEVFGHQAQAVAQLFDHYALWTKRVYRHDIFGEDHERRTEWRTAFRQVFGEDGQKMLRALEDTDRFRIAPVAGLTTMLESISYIFSGSSSDHDRVLAQKLDAAWDTQKLKVLYEPYDHASIEEKRALNSAFSKRFSAALQILFNEAERRYEEGGLAAAK